MTRGTVQREQIYVYGTCDLCGDTNVLVYERDEKLVCAEDSRKIAQTKKFIQPCDNCGQPNAIRDPSHRRNEYLCWSCHEGNGGYNVKDSVIKRAFVAVNNTVLAREKIRCDAAGYGSECDLNIKPRSAWGGRLLCNVHGKTPPAKEKKNKS